MAFTFDQLITEVTDAETFEELKGFLQDSGINTTNWTPTSPSTFNLMLAAYMYAEIRNRIADQSKNQLNQYATGEALTELARSRFQNERVMPKRTVGDMWVTSTPEIRPVTYPPGTLKVKDPTNSFQFWNDEQIVFTDGNPSGSYRFIAEQAGSSYNIPTDVTMSLVTTQVGIEVTTPAYSTGASTWYYIAGTDEETDESLRQRNATKFATLQRGESIWKGIESIVREATQIEYVYVDDTNPRGPGTFDVYISNPLELPTSTSINFAQDALNQNIMANDTFLSDITGSYRGQIFAADPVYFDRAITVLHDPSYVEAEIQDSVFSALDDYVSNSPVGGFTFQVGSTDFGTNVADLSSLYDILMDIDGVRKVVIEDCDINIAIGTSGKLLPPLAGWDSLVTVDPLNIIRR